MEHASNPIAPGSAIHLMSGAAGMWPYQVHGHTCYELIVMRGCGGQLVVNDHQGPFRTGTAFLIAPGVAHSFHSQPPYPEPKWGVSRPTDMALDLIYFDARLIDAVAIPELSSLAPLLSRSRLGLQFEGAVVQRVRQTIEGILATSFLPERIAGTYTALRQLAEAGGTALTEHGATSPYRDEELARLEKLRELMRRQFREPMSLDQAAGAIGVSASTVNHLLAKYARTTFLRMLSNLRLEEAKHLLRATDDDITSIAFAAGFGSLATFNRRFRRAVGLAPHDYRLHPD